MTDGVVFIVVSLTRRCRLKGNVLFTHKWTVRTTQSLDCISCTQPVVAAITDSFSLTALLCVFISVTGGRGILKKNLSLCYSIVYYYNGVQRYEQFLQVGRLHRSLILLGFALSSEHLCVFSLYCLHPSLYLLVSWAWWDWPLTWLTNHRPSVLWHCWLGRVTHKIVSEMTYNVSIMCR